MSERTDIDAMAAPDWLDRMLADDGRSHRADYLADDGFTACVAAALPPVATLPAWRTPVVALLWTVTAAGVAFALPGAVTETLHEIVRVLAKHPVSLIDIAGGLAVIGTAGWAATAYVLRRSG
jgi:hypothetical protein